MWVPLRLRAEALIAASGRVAASSIGNTLRLRLVSTVTLALTAHSLAVLLATTLAVVALLHVAGMVALLLTAHIHGHLLRTNVLIAATLGVIWLSSVAIRLLTGVLIGIVLHNV